MIAIEVECPHCHEPTAVEPQRYPESGDGVQVCKRCGGWFRLEDEAHEDTGHGH